MMDQIHPTAVICPGAVIGEGTTVGPYSVIGPKVVIGRGNRIASHVVIEGNTHIGDENVIFQFASVGAAPQDLKYSGEDSVLEIGNKNIIREYVTLQPGTKGGGMITKIGSGNLFMANCHVGHDGIVGDGNIFANSAALAGHVTVGSFVTVGGLAAVHQFVRLGDYSLIGGGAMANKDVPPYCIVQGDHAGLVGINVIGLERRGFSGEEIQEIRKLYRDLFVSDSGAATLSAKVKAAKDSGEYSPKAVYFLEFIEGSKRGIAFPRKKSEL